VAAGLRGLRQWRTCNQDRALAERVAALSELDLEKGMTVHDGKA
jgi:hypothetical protein